MTILSWIGVVVIILTIWALIKRWETRMVLIAAGLFLCIISMDSIYTISKYFNSRLKVTVSPRNIEPIIVPRDRVQSFLEWIEGA